MTSSLPDRGRTNGQLNGASRGGRRWWPFGRRHRSERSSDSFRQLALQLHLDLARLEGGRAVLLATAEDAAMCCGTTLELAWFLAQEHGHRVLVVDASLEARELSRQMGQTDSEGLLEYLADEGDEPDTRSVVTDHERVWFLPSGRRRAGMGQVLGRRGLERGLQRLRRQFDYLLVCAPPLLSDAAGLGFVPVVDCVLLLAQEGKTRLDDLDTCERLLTEHEARHVGLVLSEPLHAHWRGGSHGR